MVNHSNIHQNNYNERHTHNGGREGRDGGRGGRGCGRGFILTQQPFSNDESRDPVPGVDGVLMDGMCYDCNTPGCMSYTCPGLTEQEIN
mmetsp:Transcript_22231/g.21369  ORF Transcript_22231/g.21369 Transcript_22231/m.21369 type:complete len:89 (-) Transcript_22231:42-308(-)